VSVFNRNTCRVLSYDVLRQQKTRVMTKRGFDLPSSPAYNVEPKALWVGCNNVTDARRQTDGRLVPQGERKLVQIA